MSWSISDQEHPFGGLGSPVLHKQDFDASNHILRDIGASFSWDVFDEITHLVEIRSELLDGESFIVLNVSVTNEADADSDLTFLLALLLDTSDDLLQSLLSPIDPPLHGGGTVEQQA